MQKHSKIYIAGHKGMVGSALTRHLLAEGYENLVFTSFPPNDLTDQKTVAEFFSKEKPEYVFLAAAKVGGIMANNTYRAQFIYENLMIQNNIIHQSYVNGVKKLLFLGSSCIYPKDCPQPIKEEYLLTGPLEYTNEPYAIAKIAGIKLCESYNIQYGTNFISVMPTNLYGPNDNYNLKTSHVLPALIRKIYLGKCLENNDWEAIRKDLKKYPIEDMNENSGENEIIQILNKYGIKRETRNAKPLTLNPQTVTITLWGTGEPFREFMHVDDLADACLYLMNKVDLRDLIATENDGGKTLMSPEIRNTHINIGTGKDITIKALAELIKEIVGFNGIFEWDSTKSDGTYKKLLDVGKIRKLGWTKKTGLADGIRTVYDNYKM